MKLIHDLLKDGSGKYSLSKFIHLLVGISAVVLMWKMILNKEVTDVEWIAFLAYGAGQVSINKFLDKKKDEEHPICH